MTQVKVKNFKDLSAWEHMFTSTSYYSESSFNYLKNEPKMKFLGAVVFELWPFKQYGS